MSTEANADERRRFAAHNRERLAARYRYGIASAIAVSVAMTPTAYLAYPLHRRETMGAALLAGLVMVISRLAITSVWIRERAVGLTVIVANAVAICAALGAAPTGGWMSPFASVLFLVWIFVAAFLPMSSLETGMVCAPMPFVFGAALAALGANPVPPPMLTVVIVGAHAYAALGVMLRLRADLDSFVAHNRLAETRERLSRVNHELEERVTRQVAQIIERADQVEALNAQLRVEVQERSRQLRLTLERVGGLGGFAEIQTGVVLGGRARIEGPLGSGGMASVYAGTDLLTGDPVAVKVMRGESISPERVRRFIDEAEAAANVDHPVVVKTLAVDVDDEGRPFQILERVEGVSLRAVCRKRACLDVGEVAVVGELLAGALAAAHRQGVIHRDVKPSNVLLSPCAPGVRLLDFGIAKRVEADASRTTTGEVLGTPAYMSPEHVDPETDVSPASDVYSLGVTLYELLLNRRPFAVEGASAQVLAHLGATPRPISPDDAPPEFAALLLAMLEKVPAARPSMADVHDAMRAFAARYGAPAPTSLFDQAIAWPRMTPEPPTHDTRSIKRGC